jgi:DNA-binding ferritin-like protein (Dps family)
MAITIDLQQQFKEMDTSIRAFALVDEIAQKLCLRIVLKQSLIEIMFWQAVHDKAAPADIISTFIDCIKDNEKMIADLIRNELNNKIKRYAACANAAFLPSVSGLPLPEKSC